MLPSKKISIVIPAFNEEKRIGATIEGLVSTFRQAGWNDNEWEIIIVDDGSQDNTPHLLSQLLPGNSSLRTIHHYTNLGKGQALRRGVIEAHGEIIIIYDADSATPPAMILKYIPLVAEGNYDVIIGSRELGIRMGHDVTYTAYRRFAGRIFAQMANRVIPGYLDTQCGFKLLRHEVAYKLFSMLRQKQFAWDVELLALAKQFSYRVIEVPVDWHHQPESKVHLLKDSLRMVWQLMQIKRRMSKIGKESWFEDAPCPICGGTYWNKITTYQTWTIGRCGVCGMESISPKPNPHEMPALYDQDYFMSSDKSIGYNDYLLWQKFIKKTAIKRLKIIEQWIKPPASLLEIGCATGYFMEIAKARGWDVKGIEISPWAAEVAQKQIGHDKIICAPVEEALNALSHQQFHAIVQWDVIEHVLEPNKMLKMLHDLLVPNGLIAITTPDSEGLLARMKGIHWSNYAKVPEHISIFGKTNFCQLLDQYDYSIKLSKSHGKYAPFGVILNRLLQIIGINAKFFEYNTLINRAGIYCNPTDIMLVIATVGVRPPQLNMLID